MPETAQRRDSRHPPRPGRLARNLHDPVNDADCSHDLTSAPGSASSESRESFDVRFWKIRVCKGKRGRTYSVRWTVAGQEFHDTFGTSTLADSRLAELRTFARNGVAFDVASGLPAPEIRQAQTQAQAQATEPDEVTWYDHAVRYVARRWDGLSPNSRRSIAETLTTVTRLLIEPDPHQPGEEALRHALYLWAFRNQPDPPEEAARILSWVAGRGAAPRKKKPRTTVPAPAGTPRPSNLLERDFTAASPTSRRVAGITYVETACGFVYTSFVTDLFSRRIAGWQVSESLRPELALDALGIAIWSAGDKIIGGKLIHHSDRGMQYTSIRHAERLGEIGAVRSVGSKGDS